MKVRKCLAHLVCENVTASAQASRDYTDLADPLFGVGSATSAGPTLPAGSIHPSPETLEKDCGGYLREQPIIGFGNTFISGAGGVKCYGNYLIAPTLGKVQLDHNLRAAYAVEGTESSRCYEYKVKLENGIGVRLTPAHDAAIYEIDYPTDSTAVLIADAAHKLDIDAALKYGSVTVDKDTHTVTGGGLYFGNWNKHDWEMFFALRFDKEPEELGVFRGNELISCADPTLTVSINEPERLGAYARFKPAGTDPLRVRVKIAISFVSVQRALEYLDGEICGFDYDAVRDAARKNWQSVLGAIELESDDRELKRRFYTAMYHMNVQPRDRRHDHGCFDDFHTVWDTWKTVFPMYSLLYPEKMGAIIDSFIDRAKRNEGEKNGVVIADEFMCAKEFLAGQGGNDVDNVIADAYLKGVRLHKHEWEDAYAVLLKSAELMRSPEYVSRGFATGNAVTVTGLPYTFRFKSAAATMGFAFNDNAIASVARELGTPEEYERYKSRSANWLNVWNEDNESDGFFGFPQSPNGDGSFAPGFDAHGGYNSHFYEATGWDASYINYNDVPRLVKAMGGAEKFTERLLWACSHSVNYYNDDEGREGYLNFTNEPSFQIPWLFCTDEIARPDLAAEVIDGIIKRFSKKDDYPGDEDNGGMSSYYIFLMCGIFPYATTENYYLHGTRVERITFHLGCGRDLLITGEGIGDGSIYVQSASWQGKPLNTCKLTHSQILEGGELHFVMGKKPSDWAKKS